jgi:hypothetical protein
MWPRLYLQLEVNISSIGYPGTPLGRAVHADCAVVGVCVRCARVH